MKFTVQFIEYLLGKMRIGKDVTIADNVFVSDHLHGFEDISCGVMRRLCSGPVVIEDEVWLGERVCVMPKVTIGKHAVIGANSVVTKDIPPYSIVSRSVFRRKSLNNTIMNQANGKRVK